MQEFADDYRLLAGRATLREVCLDRLKRNTVALPKITVADAVALLKQQPESDGKSSDRQKQMAAALDAVTAAFNHEVHTLTPKLIAAYLTALQFKERTKANHRDTFVFFNRWLVLRSYEHGLELRRGMGQWFGDYNDYRPHQSLGHATPSEVYHAPESHGVKPASWA